MKSDEKVSKLFFYVRALSLVGIILAIYLLIEQITQTKFQPCYINSTINCNAIISGPVAKTFGIPTPLFGLTGYTVIFIASFLRKKKLILSMASFGLGFCLWIAYRELFELRVICPVCILCQIIMLSVFTLSIILLKKKNEAITN